MKLRRALWNSLPRAANDDTAWGVESFPAAVLVCTIGFFLRILFSEQVLNIVGINYGSEDAGLLSKIHPGSYLILISFFILLGSRRNPLEQIIRMAREHTAFVSFLAIYLLIIIYWIMRGPKGIGMIIDTHIVLPIACIVFSYAPRHWYRPIVYAFTSFVVLNSAVGVFESLTQLRIFPFNPDWEVLKQDYFRASAFLGHPLTNALFTGSAMFVVLGVRMGPFLKISAFVIILASLVAFGGRAALGMSLVGLIILALIESRKYFAASQLTVMRVLTSLLALIMVPALCLGLLYGALHSDMGERLMAYDTLQDDSASVRLLSFGIFDYLTPADWIFGLDGGQILSLIERTGVESTTSDIENPWILMFLFLGAPLFVLWLCGGIAFTSRLMSGASPALKIALINYLAIATTSNSFGRKDPVFMVIAGIVVCAKKLKEQQKL